MTTATRPTLPPVQQLVYSRIRRATRPLTTDEVADRCSLTRDGARSALMALKAKGLVHHMPGRPARWGRV